MSYIRSTLTCLRSRFKSLILKYPGHLIGVKSNETHKLQRPSLVHISTGFTGENVGCEVYRYS